MTGGAEINFGGAREIYLCEFERGTGARKIYPSLDQMNEVKTKNSEGFSDRSHKFKRFFRPITGDLQKKRSSLEIQRDFPAEILNFKQFFQPKTGDLQKKKGLHPKNVMKSGVSSQKVQKYRWQIPIWASICTPVLPSLLISLGHNPRLGGHKQSIGGGTAPEFPPWRRA